MIRFLLFWCFSGVLMAQSLQEAQRLNEAGNPTAALQQLNGYLQIHPEDVPALILRGTVYQNIEPAQLVDALADFQKAHQLATDNADKNALLEPLAGLYKNLFDACTQDCQNYRVGYIEMLKLQYEAYPEDLYPLRQLADFEAKQKNFQVALTALNEIIRKDSTDSVYYSYLKRAALLSQSNQTVKALNDVDKAIALYPTGNDAIIVRLIIKENLGIDIAEELNILQNRLSLAHIFRYKAYTQYSFFYNRENACNALKEAIALADDEATLYQSSFCEK